MELTAVVLAGGSGTRFAPFVTNKTMWPLMGRSALEHTLDMISRAGIQDIVVVANHDNEKIVQTYQSVSPNLRYRLQSREKGMAGALSTVFDMVSTHPMIVLNCVDFFRPDEIQRYVEYIKSHQPNLLMMGMKTDRHLPLGYFALSDARVSGVVEKPPSGKEPSDTVKMTCDYFQDPGEFISLIEGLPDEDGKDDRYEMALNKLLHRHGSDLLSTSSWSKLIYPFSVLDVIQYFLTDRIVSFVDPSARVSPLASIEGVVHIDQGAKIDAFAVVKGPAYIGRNVLVGSHSLIRQSVIEEGAVVGCGTEVARSYVGPDCQLHHAFVGDSVLEKAVNMSWGTVTTNLRLDRRSVRCKLPDGTIIPTDKVKLGAMIAQGSFLGSNVCTMPGVCIEANSNILPGSMVK